MEYRLSHFRRTDDALKAVVPYANQLVKMMETMMPNDDEGRDYVEVGIANLWAGITLALIGTEVIGCINLETPTNDNIADVAMAYVDERYRRIGLWGAMHTNIEIEAINAGFRGLRYAVSTDSPYLVPSLLKRGYTAEGTDWQQDSLIKMFPKPKK